MTVGTPEYNLDTFGIKYVKKAYNVDTEKRSERSTGSTPSTEKTPHGLDKPKDSLDLAASSTTSNLTNPSEHQQGKITTHGEGSTGTQGDKPNTGDRAITDGIGGTKKNPSYDKNNNEVKYKKPEGGAGAPIGKARLQLAINKCKLLKLKGFGGDSANSRNQKPLNPNSGDDRSFGEIRDQQGTPRPADEPQPKNKILPAIAAGARVASTVANVADSVSSSGDEVEKTTGDKIPHEKLGDLPQGKDDKKVGGTEIEDKDGKSKKLASPADRYKSEVREMAIDAIDMAMKTIAVYQDAKEKAIQEELIKEAYEAQKEAGATNTSDGGSVNFTYSDIKQKEIKTE